MPLDIFEKQAIGKKKVKEDLKSIELKIAAFEGSDAINGAQYTWLWLNNNVYDVIIEKTTEQHIIINDTDAYAFAHLKCVMEYDGKTYEDYVTLTSETVIYNAVVKFPCGSNIFHANDKYIIAYIDIYQNNHVIESPFLSVSDKEQPLVTIDNANLRGGNNLPCPAFSIPVK